MKVHFRMGNPAALGISAFLLLGLLTQFLVYEGFQLLFVVSGRQGSATTMLTLLAVLGLVLSALGGLSVWYVTRQPEELRKRVLEKHRELEVKEQYYQALMEKSSDGIILLDREGSVRDQSPSVREITGYSLLDRESLSNFDVIHPDDRAAEKISFHSLAQSAGASMKFSYRFIHRSGHFIWLEGTYTNLLDDERVKAIVCNFQDISAKVLAEQRADMTNRLYQVISSLDRMMVHARDEKIVLQEVCRITVETGKLKMAWIGKLVDARVVPVLWAGQESNYLERMAKIQLDTPNLSRGPTGMAFHLNKTVFCNDIENEPIMKPWAAEALARGYRSSIALPIFTFGEIKYVFTLYAPIPHFFDAKEIALLEGAASDISFALEGIEREIQLRKSLEDIRMLSTVASRTTNQVVITDPHQRIEWVNDSFCQFTGFSPEEVIGKVPRELLAGPKTDPAVMRRIQTTLDMGKPATEEVTFYTKKGEEFIVLTSVNQVYNDKGEVLWYVGIHTDLTARKEYERNILAMAAEQTYLIDNANAIIFGVDRSGKINEWNLQTARLTGFPKEQVMGLKLIGLLTTPKTRRRALTILMEGLNGKLHDNLEITFHNLEKKKFVLLVGTTPRKNTRGEIVGIIVVCQDITELTEYRRALEEKVAERTRELDESLAKEKELTRFKTRFVSMVSHEFRTPIATLSMAAQFVREYRSRITPEEVDTKLHTILRQAELMTDLLEDTLEMGKAQESHIRLKKTFVHLPDFFEAIREQVENAYEKTHVIQIDLVLSRLDWETDEGLLRNIFVNLLGNAIKFSPGKGRVWLEGIQRQDHYVFTVRDEGIGFASDKMDRLFEPFVRGSNVKTISGTGLGLPIVSRAVDALGGSISVTSQPEKGTHMVVSLPFR